MSAEKLNDASLKEVIILAGGLGTRLKGTIRDIPKCLAEVAGKPMLSYIIDYLRLQGITRFIFSLGYKAEKVLAYLDTSYPTLDYQAVIEEEPMGTGGATLMSLTKARTTHVLVVNGDTLFLADLSAMYSIAVRDSAECLVALKPMKKFDRYGSVDIDSKGQIKAFREKTFHETGYINGGIYILHRSPFLARGLSGNFSFEKDYLERYAEEGTFFGAVQDAYFIDIGIPEDYHKAGRDLQRNRPELRSIDRTWSIFLDRDGVINHEIVGHYVLNKNEFRFLDGVPEAISTLSDMFGKVFVVSNQRGIGRGLMSERDLAEIHKEMQKSIEEKGGKIDRIYYCTETDNSCFDRKPNPGMALKAVKDFPSVSLNRSVMVGNKPSDMRFGRSAGMVTVFVTTTNPDQEFPHPDIDYLFPSLPAFVEALKH